MVWCLSLRMVDSLAVEELRAYTHSPRLQSPSVCVGFRGISFLGTH